MSGDTSRPPPASELASARDRVSDLGEHTWPEVAAARPMLVVPLGSCEQHGPHLPLDTDTRIAVAIARGLAARRARTVVAPALGYGASGEHAAFAGTLSIGSDGLELALVELARSADHFAGVVFVNGHGGNNGAIERAVARLRSEGRRALAWSPPPVGDAHAGRVETSLLLAIAPQLVRMERAERGCLEPLAAILPAMRSGGVVAVSPNGVLGDPTGASPAEGEAFLAAWVDDLAGAVVAADASPA